MISVGVVLTCYNRKEFTLRCLRNVFGMRLPQATELKVYLVDDSSPDGTGEAVRSEFPSVHVIQGNGQLFWGGGMRLAFGQAIDAGHDFYLWLNDDVEIKPDGLARLLETYREVAPSRTPAIVAGATCDKASGAVTYGGRKRHSFKPVTYTLIAPDPTVPLKCDTINGNIVLISSEVANIIGNIDSTFTQHIGDFDYGLRARRGGIPVWLAPGFVGNCTANRRKFAWADPANTLLMRLQSLNRPPNLAFREFLIYAWRYGGVLGLIEAVIAFRAALFPQSSR